jgi:hypothetical protein
MNLVAPATSDPADFTTRLRTITEELRVIQKDLYEMSASLPAKSGVLEKHEHQQLVNSLLDLTMLADLKVVVDQVRQVLRTYIDTVAHQAANHLDYPLQVYRIQRATEALRLLHQGAEQLAAGDMVKSTFIERIDSVVEERLRSESKPADAPRDAA